MAQRATAVVSDPAEAVQRAFAGVDPDGPGVAAAVAVDGEDVVSAACGLTSLEHRVPVGAETVFYLASTSKQFVGAAIAMLEAEGKLDGEDPIVRYFPELERLEGDVRVHHLLHHTSGIRDKYALSAIGGRGEEDHGTDAASLRRLSLQRELNFPPGTRFMYSNSNYFLLAQLVQRVSGMSLSAFTSERIFKPLGMTSTLFRDDASMVIRNRASGYIAKSPGEWSLAEYTFSSVEPGGVYSTVTDMARWADGLRHGRLQPGDLDERLQRTRPLVGGDANAYGFGVMVGELFGRRCIHHSGGVQGHSAEMMRFPDDGITVICLANSSSLQAPARARAIAAALFDTSEFPNAAEESEATDAGASADARTGMYLAEDRTMLCSIEHVDARYALAVGAQRIPLEPNGRALRVPGGPVLRFDGDLMSLGDEMRFRRLEQSHRQPDLKPGTYHSDELELSVAVAMGDDGPTITRGALGDVALRWAAEDVFYFDDPTSARVVVWQTEGGNELFMSGPRAAAVRFTRV